MSYKVAHLPWQKEEETLNELAKEGWILISVVLSGTHNLIAFLGKHSQEENKKE